MSPSRPCLRACHACPRPMFAMSPACTGGRGAARRCPRTGAPARAVLPVVLNSVYTRPGSPASTLGVFMPLRGLVLASLLATWNLPSLRWRPPPSSRAPAIASSLAVPAPSGIHRGRPAPPPVHPVPASLSHQPASPRLLQKASRIPQEICQKLSLASPTPVHGGRAGEREFPPSPPGAEPTQPVETRPLAAALIHSLGHEARCPRGGLR